MSDWRFQGSTSSPSQRVRERSSINSCNSNSFFGMADTTFFSGIKKALSHLPAVVLAICYILLTSNPSEHSLFQILLPVNCYGISANQLVVIQNCGALAIQLSVTQKTTSPLDKAAYKKKPKENRKTLEYIILSFSLCLFPPTDPVYPNVLPQPL